MDEGIVEKVNQMTKIVMARTAEESHPKQDSLNLEDLVTSLQGPEDDCPAGCEDHSFSYCLFSRSKDLNTGSKPWNSLSLAYRKFEKLASAKELIRIPVLVQTRAQR